MLDTVKLFKIQLLTLQEFRWPNNGNITKENMSLLYSGTNNEIRKNGVGIIVHKCLLPQVKSFKPVNDKTCYVILKGKYFDVVVISCYGPTEEKAVEEKDNFYEELEDVYDKLPRYCIKIFIGNFNAKIDQSRLCLNQRQVKTVFIK